MTTGDDGVSGGLEGGATVSAKAALITAGIGKFSPRPLPAADDWIGRGVEFFVPSFAPYQDKDVVIVGGGDSAFDWAVHLEPIARSVTLVHRRDAFRAHERTVEKVRASSVETITRAAISAARGGSPVEELDISVGNEATTPPPQARAGAPGFNPRSRPLKR